MTHSDKTTRDSQNDTAKAATKIISGKIISGLASPVSQSGFQDRSEHLSQKEEMLIMRFADGECRFFERWKAQRLLARSTAACNCLAQFKDTSVLSRDCLTGYAPSRYAADDFLARIDRRIAEEQKLAFILGERQVFADRSSPNGKWSLRSVVSSLVNHGGAWAEVDVRFALAGSVAAAVAVAAILGPTGLTGPKSGPESGPALQLAALDEGPGIRLTQDRIPQATSVDWVRGGGRIELVRTADDDASNTPVIWIKRRNESSLSHSARGLPRRRSALSDAYAISHGR